MGEAERYALGLLVEEMGEALCHIGRALRFGLDTLGQDGISERNALTRELGDVDAAANFACEGGLIESMARANQSWHKMQKLIDPNAKDNLGRRLAPAVPFAPSSHREGPDSAD